MVRSSKWLQIFPSCSITKLVKLKTYMSYDDVIQFFTKMSIIIMDYYYHAKVLLWFANKSKVLKGGNISTTGLGWGDLKNPRGQSF